MKCARCVNIDWLEVLVLERNQPHDSEYFRCRGFIVSERDYGTRIYGQMFTLDGSDGEPFIEIRRQPKNPLMLPQMSHIRLVNRACYFDNAADLMADFINSNDYDFQRITRIDICLDFDRFDDNTIPRVFMQRYMRGKFSKINQANIHSHGSDQWTGRVWNSVSWGSPASMISTKFYNKTLELYDAKTNSYKKPYILQAWLRAGYIDNMYQCSKDGNTVEMWRVEFSIKSSVKRWFVIELDGKQKAYQSIRNMLDCYNTKPKLLCIFASLARHYFHFKRYIMEQRKDRCPDRVLFKWNDIQHVVKPDADKPETIPMATTAPLPLLLILIKNLKNYLNLVFDVNLKQQIQELITQLEHIQLRAEQPHKAPRDYTLALQLLMKRRAAGILDANLQTILAEVKKALSINDKTAIF